MSGRLSWIEHKGAKILYVDYSGLSEKEFVQTIEEFKNELLKQAPGSVVTLSNTADTYITSAVRDKFQELNEQTRGISKGAAGIGITGFKKVLAGLVKSDMYFADSLEEAIEWLAEQAKK